VYGRLERLTHYELLGVSRNADKKEIKRAYFQLASVVHTDRYFGKKLGSYKPKMEAIFARMSAAFATLTDKEQRSAYDAKLGAPAAGSPSSAPKAPVDPKVLAARQAAMEALKKRFTDGRAKAKEHAHRAALAKAAGDHAAAAEAYRLALSFTPDDVALKVAYEDERRAAEVRLAESHVRQAMLEERYGHWAQAAASWKRVVDARPNDANARARLANALARAKDGA
jgi:curved DNA-binding protein CbpA